MSTSPSNSNVGILAAGIYPSLDSLRNQTPPTVQRFARVLGFPKLLRFLPLDTTDIDDGWTVITPAAGTGSWLAERVNDRGNNIAFTAGAVTIGVYDGPWQVVPAASAATNSTITLDPTGAQLGDTLEISRLDLSAYTITVVNGGPGAGTLSVFPVSVFGNQLFWFDGTNWLRRR